MLNITRCRNCGRGKPRAFAIDAHMRVFYQCDTCNVVFAEFYRESGP